MNNYNFYPTATAPIQPSQSPQQPQNPTQFMQPPTTMMYSSQQMQQPQPQMQPMQMTMPQQMNMLNGKIVDSIDLVRVTEVPIGGYGVFPKADFSEVYIKAWNPNGTTSIYQFKPCSQESPQTQQDSYNKILNEIEQLKSLFAVQQSTTIPQGQNNSATTFVSPQVEHQQKEVKSSDY